MRKGFGRIATTSGEPPPACITLFAGDYSTWRWPAAGSPDPSLVPAPVNIQCTVVADAKQAGQVAAELLETPPHRGGGGRRLLSE